MKTEGAQKSSALQPTSAKYPKPCLKQNRGGLGNANNNSCGHLAKPNDLYWTYWTYTGITIEKG